MRQMAFVAVCRDTQHPDKAEQAVYRGLALAGGGDGLVGLSPRRPGSDCEMGKIIFGDETNGHETVLACPSVFHANAGRLASVPVNKS